MFLGFQVAENHRTSGTKWWFEWKGTYFHLQTKHFLVFIFGCGTLCPLVLQTFLGYDPIISVIITCHLPTPGSTNRSRLLEGIFQPAVLVYQSLVSKNIKQSLHLFVGFLPPPPRMPVITSMTIYTFRIGNPGTKQTHLPGLHPGAPGG